MAYDALTESVKLIGSRRVEPVRRLSRRRRFAAMSVDVAGDVAVTTFARRGVGCTWHDTHALALRKGRWALLGGGSSAEDDVLTDRPVVLPAELSCNAGALRGANPGPIVAAGGGGFHDGGDRAQRWPWAGRWISYADVRVTTGVTSLAVADRLLAVP